MLSSAATMPRITFAGQRVYAAVYEMAAAYMFHIIRNHPFIDGNKRTGAVAAIVFLKVNECKVEIDNEEMFSAAMAVADGRLDKSDLAGVFKRPSGREKAPEE